MSDSSRKIVASNKRAFFDYEILERLEAGIVLRGPEIKSIRMGHASINSSFAHVDNGEMWLMNAYVQEYDKIAHEKIDPRRNRKLLIAKRQIMKWQEKTAEKGFTIVPLHLYFSKNLLKIELGLAKSKKNHDKREAIKERDIKRETERAVRRY